ncbi:MAG: hypothetical protein WBA77_21115 [Microcoleaceae cyanobacterium]
MELNKRLLKINSLFEIFKKPVTLGLTALVSSLIVACDSVGENATAPTDTAEVETVTELDDVAEDGDELIGQTVTISGKVEEILGTDALILADDDDLFTEDEVLVLSVDNLQNEFVLSEGEDAEITGEVVQLVVAEFERDYDITWDLELKQKIEAEYEGKIVVVADVTRVE